MKMRTNLFDTFLVDDCPIILEILARLGLYAIFFGKESALVLLAFRKTFTNPLGKKKGQSFWVIR